MSHSVLPTDSVSSPAGAPVPQRPFSRTRMLIKGTCVAALVIFVAECLRIFVGSNFHTVVPGKCYRSAQPTPSFLESVKRSHGICTVINLRDENPEEWYRNEKKATENLKIKLRDAGLSSKEQPPEIDFHRFVKHMKEAQEPILIHCANGNDRSGLASAVYLILRTDTSLKDARGHLSLRYGHFAWTKASCLHRILDGYEGWLSETGKTHQPDHFYFWAMNVYRQEDAR